MECNHSFYTIFGLGLGKNAGSYFVLGLGDIEINSQYSLLLVDKALLKRINLV